ncbi:alpha/beta hydrolase [Methylocapsa sp. S129]|uniref:alpha/beta hydrolase n=1 Tax=Methylocapsa sp. S129 TaxID=1641869 RepID=UPI00131ACC2F|nr:alpha/beta hydrolase [Methylocapsa sp. S129]
MSDSRHASRLAKAAAGLALALLVASCAGGPPVTREAGTPNGSFGPQFANAGGVNVAMPEFQNSAFPYHGLIPASADNPGKDRPFMNVDDKGRLGHQSPRGGVYWEDATYSDRHVLLAASQNFDSRNPGDLVIFFHGNEATLSRDVLDRQQAPRQLADSGLNGVMIAPQMAVDAMDSSAGRFWKPGALAEFLDEAEVKLAALYPGASRSTFSRMPVILVAYSGGYLPAAFALAQGGASERVRGVVLLDALYGEEDKFADWIEREHNRAFFVSAYSKSSHDQNEALRRRLAQAGVNVQDGMPETLGPGVVAFIDAGDVDHNGFVNSAWTSNPLRDVLARVAQ